RLFSYATGFSSLQQPISNPGVGVYAGTNNPNGAVVGLATDGTELWRPPVEVTAAVQAQVVPGPFVFSPGVSQVVVADQSGKVSMVSANDGSLSWQVGPLGDRIQATPTLQLQPYSNIALPDDLIFVGTSNTVTLNPNKITALA